MYASKPGNIFVGIYFIIKLIIHISIIIFLFVELPQDSSDNQQRNIHGSATFTHCRFVDFNAFQIKRFISLI